jgi:hypothetical protein
MFRVREAIKVLYLLMLCSLGQWQLVIGDWSNTDEGTLNQFTIEVLCTQAERYTPSCY